MCSKTWLSGWLLLALLTVILGLLVAVVGLTPISHPYFYSWNFIKRWWAGSCQTSPRQRKLNNGVRAIMIVKNTAKMVLHQILVWGTPKKPSHMSLLDYLQSLLPGPSPNYVNIPHKMQKFNKTQLENLRNGTFDVTLLYLCIKLSCDNVAMFNDSKWHTEGTELENYIYSIKDKRNEIEHGELSMDDAKFLATTAKIRDLLLGALAAAKNRFGRSEAELKAVVEMVNNDIHCISQEILGADDLVEHYGDRLREDLMQDCRTELEEKYKHMAMVSPLSFVTGLNMKLDVSAMFTDIELEQLDSVDSTDPLPYQDILSASRNLTSPITQQPQIIIVEGEAGAGKTTLLALLIKQWCERDVSSVRSLDTYSLIIHMQCWDPTTCSYNRLLDSLLPRTSLKYLNLRDKLLDSFRVLVLIDGFDQVNHASELLVKDLLYQHRLQNTTIIVTTRPEKSKLFLSLKPDEYSVAQLGIKGVPWEKRVVFVNNFHPLLQDFTGSGRDTQCLVSLVRNFGHQDLYCLPIMLIMLTWVYDQSPEAVQQSATYSELYHLLHQLCRSRLLQQLPIEPGIMSLSWADLQNRVDEVILELGLAALRSLACSHLSLSQLEKDRITAACECRNLPAKVLMSTFFTLQFSQGTHLYFPLYKEAQEFLAARYIVVQLSKLPAPTTIAGVLEEAVLEPQPDLIKYKSVLSHVAGLLPLLLGSSSTHWADEVVLLLHEAGVKRSDQWLDLLQHATTAKPLLLAVKNYINTKSINITDCYLGTWVALLPHVAQTKVKIVLVTDPTHLDLPGLWLALSNHNCTKLFLHFHYRHPAHNHTSDGILQQAIDNRFQLQVFTGYLTREGIAKLPESVVELCVALESNHHAADILTSLHSQHLPKLRYLGLHVAKDVGAEGLQQVRVQARVRLEVSDVEDSTLHRTCQVVRALQPEGGYCMLDFPRAQVTAEGWQKLISELAEGGVTCRSISVPDTGVTQDTRTLLDTMASTTLNCTFKTDKLLSWQ